MDNDFTLTGYGSLFLLTPLNADAKEWVTDHFPTDVQTLGNAIAIEHRYIGDICDGLAHDGFTVEVS